MKRLLFILFSLLAFGVSRAQYSFPLYPNNVFWSTWECDSANNCELQFCAYDLENNFCGFDYSLGFITPSNEFAYFRTANEKVYIRNSANCVDKEFLMYDFSLQIGDSTYCGYNINQTANDTTRFWVTNITTEQFVGIDRKVLYMNYFIDPPTNSTIGNMKWIQGIGSDANPFYSMDCMPPFCNKTQELICYDSTSIQLYLSANFLDCTGTPNGIENIGASNTVQFGPNPFTDEVTIYFDRKTTATATIYTITGQQWQKTYFKKQEAIRLGNNWPTGIYFVEIASKYGKTTTKLVKVGH